MLRSTSRWKIAVFVALFSAVVPRGAFAQATASISGVVKDAQGAVLPGVSVVIKNDASGQSQDLTTDAEGRYQASALGAGSYTVTAILAGFKTATSKGVRVAPGQPVSIPLTLEIGQLEETVVVTSSSELINTENGTVAATLNSDQLTRMPTATRNALNAVAFLPGVNVDGHQPRLDDQRPAGELPEHHHRRREQQRQLPAQHGRLLRVRHAAAGRGRGRVGHALRRWRPGRRRRRRRDDGVPDAVGRQPVHRQRLRVLPEPELQHELLLQRDQRPAEERRRAEPVRRAARWTDRDPGPVRRPQQGLLLRPLRADPLPEQLHAHPDGLQSARLRRLVPLPVRRPGARGQPAAAGGRQRPDLGDRPDDDEAARADRRGDEDDRHARRPERSALRQLRLAEPVEALRAPADGAPRLQPHEQPPTPAGRGPRSRPSGRPTT